MQKILIVVLIVAVVGLAGVLVWQNYGKVEPIVNNQPPITDETANWKTYTNVTHKYTIEYPASWFVDDKDVDNVNLTNLQYVNVIGNSGPVTENGSYFLVRVYDLTIPLYKESWPAGVHDISDLKDNGLVSIMPLFRPDGPTIVYHIGQDIYFTNGTFGYIFQFGSGSEEQDQRDYSTFKDIVKSFKFIE